MHKSLVAAPESATAKFQSLYEPPRKQGLREVQNSFFALISAQISVFRY